MCNSVPIFQTGSSTLLFYLRILSRFPSLLPLTFYLPFSAIWGFLFIQNRPPSETGEGNLYPENIKAKTKNERELVQYHPTIEEVRGFWWINRCDAGTDGVCGASSPQTGGPYTKMASQPCHFHLPRRELARRRGEESGKMREPAAPKDLMSSRSPSTMFSVFLDGKREGICGEV